MINLETPRKHATLIDQAHQLAMNMLRPISRKYDRAEHAYPKELDMLAALIDGVSETGASSGAGASGVRRDASAADDTGKVRNGANLASVLILALGVVRREARAAGRRPSHHLAHLVVHGALHLQGHDHGLPGDARRMEMAETRLLHRMGVPDPWRTARRRP